MPVLALHNDCMGCTACESVCPVAAISMNPNGMGFKYPVVDLNKCIECKKCEKACPIVTPIQKKVNYPKSYAAQLKDASDLMQSQSGGAFDAIASEILKYGGIVYGASFKKDLSVSHQRIEDPKDLIKLKGSKYVQSELNNIFKTVLDDLKNGKFVLFSGVPCQIAGLKRSIPLKLQENLFCVDIVCHGVPGPEVYRQYLVFLENKYHKEIKEYNFRDKNFGWRTSKESVLFEDGQKIESFSYNFLYLQKDYITRKACSVCRFCNLDRMGDITIADCWGWEKLHRSVFEEDKGISLILINSEKGEKLFDRFIQSMNFIEVSLEPYLMQRNLRQPTERPKLADKVQSDFVKYGFAYINRKYGYTKKNLLRYKVQRYSKALHRRIKKYIGI